RLVDVARLLSDLCIEFRIGGDGAVVRSQDPVTGPGRYGQSGLADWCIRKQVDIGLPVTGRTRRSGCPRSRAVGMARRNIRRSCRGRNHHPSARCNYTWRPVELPVGKHRPGSSEIACSMKLIIQIPCLNESGTLAIALGALPRQVPGFDTVEWLIIDDGSTDNTGELAKELGVDHVIRHAVNQYEGADIPKLTAPVLAGEADMVIGARPISETEHFSWVKKKLQHLGSWAVRMASKTQVEDAPSGFRAISRETALQLNVFNA